MSQAGFSPGIPPAVGCYSTVFTEYLGSLCRKKGALLVLGEHSSIERPVFSSEDRVASRGALRSGTGEKQGSEVLVLFGHSLGTKHPGHRRSVLGAG